MRDGRRNPMPILITSKEAAARGERMSTLPPPRDGFDGEYSFSPCHADAAAAAVVALIVKMPA